MEKNGIGPKLFQRPSERLGPMEGPPSVQYCVDVSGDLNWAPMMSRVASLSDTARLVVVEINGGRNINLIF